MIEGIGFREKGDSFYISFQMIDTIEIWGGSLNRSELHLHCVHNMKNTNLIENCSANRKAFRKVLSI